MSKYSIIQIGSFQYTVEEGSEYTVERFDAEVGKDFKVSQVLAIGDGDKLVLGKPLVDNAEVTLDILSQEKGEKITSKIYKAKSRYRRTRGFRKQVTKFKVTSIKY
jgi:large subunit ribosomal protein L21